MGAASWRHEVDDHGAAARSLELGLEDEGVGAVMALDATAGRVRRYQPPSVVAVSQQGSKTRRRVKAGPAQPIDRAIAPDQGRRLSVTDDWIVFFFYGHPPSFQCSGLPITCAHDLASAERGLFNGWQLALRGRPR